MESPSLAAICPDEYPISLQEKLIANAIVFYLRSIPHSKAVSLMRGIIQPKVIALPDKNRTRPAIISSTIQGGKLAVLIDAATAFSMEALERMALSFPDETDAEKLRSCVDQMKGHIGERFVQNLSPGFCEFLADCYCILSFSLDNVL